MKKEVGTINLTPTWRGTLPILLAGYEHGNAEGRRMALEELHRLCKIVDDLNADAGDTISEADQIQRITVELLNYSRANLVEQSKHAVARSLAELDYGDLLEIANIIRKA